jgi:hypothetical protein
VAESRRVEADQAPSSVSIHAFRLPGEPDPAAIAEAAAAAAAEEDGSAMESTPTGTAAAVEPQPAAPPAPRGPVVDEDGFTLVPKRTGKGKKT